MDPTTSPTTPLGPMTRARARALETEVTSLLSHFHFDTHETRLLPHTDTLCMLKYHGEAKGQGQGEDEYGREYGEEEVMKRKLQAPDDRPGPDVRRPPGFGRPALSGRPTPPHPSQIYGFPEPLGQPTMPEHPTPTGRPAEAHPSRNYGCLTGTGCPDPREPPDDR